MSLAYRPVVAKPPHDPYWYRLDRRAGWRTLAALTSGAMEAPDDGALALMTLPGTGAMLNDPSGSLGGLTWPDWATMLPDGTLVLLDRARGVLRRFNPCRCRFEDWPCSGKEKDAVRPSPGAGGIAAGCSQIYLCDTANQRVLVLSPKSGAVRAVWNAPTGPGLGPWEPLDAAVTRRMEVGITDPANGGVHVFSARGVRRRFFSGLGAVSSIAADNAGWLYVRISGADNILVLDAATGRALGAPSRPEELACRFPTLPIEVLTGGALDVSALCSPQPSSPLIVDSAGNPADAAPLAPAYPKEGVWVSAALDSEISRRRWHRVVLRGILAAGDAVDILSLTDESEQPANLLALRPPDDWRPAGTWTAAPGSKISDTGIDFLLESPPGRYLWLKLVLRGNGTSTPRICSLEIEFPRISLRRYLPGIFGAEPVVADFTDRWLAVFDREFRNIERKIDRQAALFDPMACPTGFLPWLAQWVGVTLERGWTEMRRRVYLNNAPKLFAWRGTVRGLRSTLYLFLGLERFLDYAPERARCVPCAENVSPGWRPPRLVLEHFKLRHWMFAGKDRLSDNAKLWGERVINRSVLGGPSQHAVLEAPSGAQLGVTQLKAAQDPCGDPFYVYAHKLSVFVPAVCVRNPAQARALDRLLALEKPAHVEARVVPVEPRFRVGVQAMLGLDAVIGWRTAPVQLDEAKLGRATALGSDFDTGPRFRVGGARIGGNTILTTEP